MQRSTCSLYTLIGRWTNQERSEPWLASHLNKRRSRHARHVLPYPNSCNSFSSPIHPARRLFVIRLSSLVVAIARSSSLCSALSSSARSLAARRSSLVTHCSLRVRRCISLAYQHVCPTCIHGLHTCSGYPLRTSDPALYAVCLPMQLPCFGVDHWWLKHAQTWMKILV